MRVSIAKFIMKRVQRFPSKADAKSGLLQEIFNHNNFLSGTDQERSQIMLSASTSKFEDELGFAGPLSAIIFTGRLEDGVGSAGA